MKKLSNNESDKMDVRSYITHNNKAACRRVANNAGLA